MYAVLMEESDRKNCFLADFLVEDQVFDTLSWHSLIHITYISWSSLSLCCLFLWGLSDDKRQLSS